MRCKIIRHRMQRKKNEEKIKEVALVAGGKMVYVMSEKALRVGVDAVYFNNLCTPSLAMSLFGGSDSGEKGNEWSREDKMLFNLMESERK